ncbi:hypothetical protein [Catenuloplanes indicus]|uniref:Uncharacterized protein n=1 Tax=Catenuloplanes indicus TaxID=137267 RepID=A0AAE3VUM7_9ACTN|nr:hypothetical protein [Catenuloplanes indicus]MDQ0363370.1 hypothetical protein [Catenuloplanes indicus]MDQ0371692.1 hypothetical protein [Catenuloplanes indicus]
MDSTDRTPTVTDVFEHAEMVALDVRAFVTVAAHTATSLTLDLGFFVLGEERTKLIVDYGAARGITVTFR